MKSAHWEELSLVCSILAGTGIMFVVILNGEPWNIRVFLFLFMCALPLGLGFLSARKASVFCRPLLAVLFMWSLWSALSFGFFAPVGAAMNGLTLAQTFKWMLLGIPFALVVILGRDFMRREKPDGT